MEENKNTLLWIVIAVVILLFLFSGFGMGGYGMMGFGMGFGFVFMLLFWVVIIWLIITLINPINNKNEQNSLTILKRRYASGEINKKQFLEMKRELRGFK